MLYWFARSICRVILVLMRRWEVFGRENLLATGGLILVANHTSYWDPVVVCCMADRPVYFMAKSELFSVPLLGKLLKKVGVFPVYRNRLDRVAVHTALKYLAEGKVVGIFPEGSRSHTGELLQPHPGAAMLALKSKAPVLPVAVIGSRGVFGKIRVFAGKPLYFSDTGNTKKDKTKIEDFSKRIMSEIAGLLAGGNEIKVKK